ncbi:MAG: hypothetical protein IR164_11980 [Devosia sp.]|uniref:hypothetical protein n=1 Tax=unclassified Devosia TaxID=196773 RepID=UPI0019DD1580|nr:MULTISPECIES: hypothetical protein [unclassified Devosia]MBF0679642.1 hypothetical protein [Devosia sp.]WEJ32207.1 hypothetical protein NYQ88_15045 [Devosia sp. SD17-2]
MLDARLALALVVAAGLVVPVQAQDQSQRLDDLDAKRINSFQILIDFEYGGSACEAVGRAEIGELVNGTLAVTFPATATSEVCTMQIEEHEIKQAIDTEDPVDRIDVTLIGADGAVIATGSTDVERD